MKGFTDLTQEEKEGYINVNVEDGSTKDMRGEGNDGERTDCELEEKRRNFRRVRGEVTRG